MPGQEAKKRLSSVSFEHMGDDGEILPPWEQVWDARPTLFPKNLLTALPHEFNEKETAIISTVPFEYFKLRVKHFEKYKASSYDEVLVNR